MKTVIDQLQERLRSMSGDELDLESFDLLAQACSACCSKYVGGNESCPPAKDQVGLA